MTKKDTQENTIVETGTDVAKAVEKVVNNVKMVDGSVKNFGVKGKLLSDRVIGDDSFELTFHVANGAQASYKFAGNMALLLEMAAFGADAKIKAATAGQSLDEIEATVKNKISEFEKGEFNSRSGGGEASPLLTQIQQAWAIVNGVDVSTEDGVAEVLKAFSAMSKDDVKALAKDTKIKVAMYKLKIQELEAATML